MKLLFCVFFLLGPTAWGKTWSSGAQQVQLVELYSSEGCSSCPPAEEWLSSLKKHDQLWKSFVPLEFHVDYWNRLGWVDPFASKKFTKRQHKYADSWGSRTVYTPGFVLQGTEWKPRRPADLTKTTPIVGDLVVTQKSPRSFEVTFTPRNAAPRSGAYQVNLALLGHDLTVKVPRGENAGRTLHHDFVVLKLVQGQSMSSAKSVYKAVIEAQASGSQADKVKSIAVWVSRDSKPVQVVGGLL